MSDVSQGEGWWQASDGKWYPPESHPAATAAVPTSGSVPPEEPKTTTADASGRPWFKRKRFVIPIGVVVLVFLITLSSGGNSNDKSTPTAAQRTAATGTTEKRTTTSVATTERTTTTVPSPSPIVLSGTGQTATSSFGVTAGLAVFTATHSGSSNFVLELLDDKGSSVDIPVNVIGSYNGSTGMHLSAGNYIFKVTADGAWQVTVTQPRSDPGVPVPHTFSGKGQQFVGPFSTPHAVRLQASHDGQSNFVVEVLDAEGETRDLPINEIGNYNGSTVVSGLSGRYYLKINADGNWTVAVSPV